MSPQAFADENQEIAERVFTDLLDGHDLDLVSELYAEDCVFYGMSGPEAIDRDEYEAFLAMYFEAFPDLSFEIEEMISDDGRVSVRWTSRGTHENDLMDVPATGKSATVTGMSFVHVEDGRIVETYNNHDRLGLLEQLGAIPDSPRKVVRMMLGQLKGRLTDR
ncbi:ester cyclase [Halalkalicoccus sp. NIPERK01]|uniref:ester cyclase n=1 Tax=Halalkalicoccus sp. NIPERK01 TaxID=3053469 RepID=UPI00256EC209|nr:ester cyclase [Halalkalicoccus sp. NIPERK01]MDL5361233.1 ester cyclase [Halalkalicoccus sp. NIPERK01]